MASLSRMVLSTMARRGRSFVTMTRPNLEKRVLKVPTMGDSITEGTIVEWTAKVGQAVKADDVVAMVETDKVTVEIKAEMDGVITEQFGAVDDTVEVGANLYSIDTDAVPTALPEETPAVKPAESVVSTPTATKKEVPPLQPPPSPAPSPSTASQRTPMIHFLGKNGWEARRRKTNETKTLEYIPPMYGRPKFTEAEIEALILGGASIAPEVTKLSAGASFK